MRDIDKIIVHCSASSFGDSSVIDGWHKERGWDGIGYHYVILNGMRSKGAYSGEDDGLIENGRNIEKKGAHVKGHNTGSIGICIIGDRLFTDKQLLRGLPRLLGELMATHKLELDNIFGHYEFTDAKTCPNLDMPLVRGSVRRLSWPGSLDA